MAEQERSPSVNSPNSQAAHTKEAEFILPAIIYVISTQLLGHQPQAGNRLGLSHACVPVATGLLSQH